jgi:hypothetical protein
MLYPLTTLWLSYIKFFQGMRLLVYTVEKSQKQYMNIFVMTDRLFW